MTRSPHVEKARTEDAEAIEQTEPEDKAGDAARLTSALALLNRSLDRLEKAVKEKRERSGDGHDEAVQVQRLNADRAALARDLDKARKEAATLSSANKDVSRRLVATMEKIRTAMEDE